MKTIYGLLMIISFAALLFGGLYSSLQEISIKNNGLTSDSLEMIDKYNVQYDNLSDFSSLDKPSTNFSSNSTNEVDSFFREYAEAKNNINKFASGINFIYHIPSIILLSIPFIELSDSSLTLYNGVIWLMMVFIVVIVFYKALRGGKVDNE